jgi:hypothetical protein
VTELQVLLDARRRGVEELAASLRTVLSQVPAVEVVHADEGVLAALADRFGGRVAPARQLRRDAHILVVPGSAALARGAVRRLLADLAVPGRRLTCVLVPGDHGGLRVACWSAGWAAGYAGTVEELVDAGLAFDRDHLPTGSATARAWLRADQVGVAPAHDVGARAGRWAWGAGAALGRDAAVARLRAPLGTARRRIARRRQRRRQQAQRAHAVR